MAGARAAGQQVEAAGIDPADRLAERATAEQDARQVEPRAEAELDVDVGEAEVAVEQQDALAAPGECLGEADREPGLADPALAGGDREAPAHFDRPAASACAGGNEPASDALASS